MDYDIYFILDEIARVIKDNLYLLLLNDAYLVDLKYYCGMDVALEFTPYGDLLYFVREALLDLLNTDLYDFREIE